MLMLDVYVDKSEWDTILMSFPNHDMYHTYDYHEISHNNGEGYPMLFVVRRENGEPLMCWPTLRREISDTTLFDLTSVFGFSGPILNNQKFTRQCFDFLFSSLKKMGIVSLFSRMHPLLVDEFEEEELRGIKLNNKFVVINTEQQQNILESYRSNHRRDIRRALRDGVETVVDRSCDRVDDFIAIYYNAMRDLGAEDYYFFSRNHILNLTQSGNFKASIIFAKLGRVDIGAAMFINTNAIMHYYIGGVVKEFVHLSPLKVILARAHELAIEKRIPNFILGGGSGGGDDTLFRFKKGFSDLDFPFFVFKKIIDKSAYEDICDKRGIDYKTSSYFPAYRYPTEGGGPISQEIISSS